MPTYPMLLGPQREPECAPEDDPELVEPERYPGEARDRNQMYRMDKLNEQLKVIFQHKLPLCGECLEFHGRGITCDEVEELMWIDQTLLRYAIG